MYLFYVKSGSESTGVGKRPKITDITKDIVMQGMCWVLREFAL